MRIRVAIIALTMLTLFLVSIAVAPAAAATPAVSAQPVALRTTRSIPEIHWVKSSPKAKTVIRKTPVKVKKKPPTIKKTPRHKTHARSVSTVRHVSGLSSLPWQWQKIAMCESTHNLHAQTGSYYGMFQIQRGWYRAAGLAPEYTSLSQQYALALKIWHVQGWHAWTCAGIVGID